MQLRDIGTAASASWRAASAMLDGRPVLLQAEQVDRRRAICGGCPDRAGAQCGKCGCYLLPKTKLATEICPVGKW